LHRSTPFYSLTLWVALLFPELTNQLFFPLGHYGLPALRAKFRGWRKFIAPLKGTARIDPIIPKGQKGFSSRMVIDVFVTHRMSFRPVKLQSVL